MQHDHPNDDIAFFIHPTNGVYRVNFTRLVYQFAKGPINSWQAKTSYPTSSLTPEEHRRKWAGVTSANIGWRESPSDPFGAQLFFLDEDIAHESQ